MAKHLITIADVESIINTVKNGEFYSVVFTRTAPKCLHCGKSNKKWVGLTHCPICGEPLSLERETLAQNGVHNPQNEEITPKGTGESAKEARADGRIKYYDPQILNANGTRGGYRQFHISSVKRLRVRGDEYEVTP